MTNASTTRPLASAERIKSAKRAFSTRNVPFDLLALDLIDDRAPVAGDLVLARVDGIGSHQRIELPCGRKAQLFVGDEILLAYGNRYAPDQYEAYVPEDLSPCHMVAAGGVAGRAECWHDKLAGPTAISPIGLVARNAPDGTRQPVNLADHALLRQLPLGRQPALFAVFGTAMNAGKTTTAAGLVKGLAAAGLTVGALKITGTAAGGDLWLMKDSGAQWALDFTDAGFATTFGADPAAILRGADNLIETLGARGCDAVVLEIADGLLQTETAAIAAERAFTARLTGTFFAAGDAMGAVDGAAKLAAHGHRLLGVSGAMTRSPLAIREARAATGLPVLTLGELMDPTVAISFLAAERPLLPSVA